MRPGVSKESERSQKSGFRLFRSLLRLRGALFRDSGVLLVGGLLGLSSDSSGVPGPKGPGDPVQGGADPNFIVLSVPP